MFFEYFFEFSKISKKHAFCEYCVCLNADSEAFGCGIDMVDGALETLDLTFCKRDIVGLASGFFLIILLLQLERISMSIWEEKG